MVAKTYKKSFEVSRDGKIIIYPSLYERKEKGKLKKIIKKLIRLGKN